MAPRAPTLSTADAPTTSKPRKGFAPGLSHLPDGPYRRKVQKTKIELIHKAQVKSAYEKLQARERQQRRTDHAGPPQPASLAPHPSRLALIQSAATAPSSRLPPPPSPPAPPSPYDDRDQPRPSPPPQSPTRDPPHQNTPQPPSPPHDPSHSTQHHPHRPNRPPPRAPPFAREARIAAERRAQAEARAAKRAAAEAQRARALDERARWQKKWAKARRPGADGKWKMGRQGKLLLEKVRRVVGAESV